MNSHPNQLAWTGERMVPFASDYATEATHWQRYLFFRPWYEDAKVLDIACGEGYGTDYASVFASSATGIDISEEAVNHASKTYTRASFAIGSAEEFDFSGYDLITSFETIEHLPNPEKFLARLNACQGRIVISTPNRRIYDPNAKLGDKPNNPYHTIEWTTEEFAELITKSFPGRQVRFLTQRLELPGRLVEGLDANAWFTIAVIGEGELPRWPKLGFSMPTMNNVKQATDCISAFVTYYPGEVEFAVVLNGTDQANTQAWHQFAEGANGLVHLIPCEQNLGYGVGANKGLDFLMNRGGYDLFGVTNDDVYPSLGCLSELTYAYRNLCAMDQNPGLVGVVSNQVNGRQQVNIGEFRDLPAMMKLANDYLHQHKSSATPWPQIRGLCFLVSPECLSSIGGFDPIFGIGNFEDDDLCLRARLAGFSSWIVDGAFLFHHGSQTFSNLKVDYNANIARNHDIFCRKWELDAHAQFLASTHVPEGVQLYVPLDSTFKPVFPIKVSQAETVDLIHQASDIEFAYWVYAQLRENGMAARHAIFGLFDLESAGRSNPSPGTEVAAA